jgi:TonB family protein
MSARFRALVVSVSLILASGAAALAPQKASAQESDTDAGKRRIVSKVAPSYPPLARQMNVAGRVKIEVTVSAEGRVVSTRVIGGSPMLVAASLDAVKKFQFEQRPRETTEIVEFQFDRQ